MMIIAVLLSFGFFGTIAALSVFWAVVSFTRGEYLTTLTVLAVAVFCCAFLAQVAIAKSHRVKVRGQFSAAGTLLRPDRRVDVVYQVSLVAAFAAMLLYAIFAPLGQMDIPIPPGLGPVYFSIGSAAGAVILALGLWQMFSRGGKSSLLLDGGGFQLHASSSVHAGWDDVHDVTDHRPRGQQSARDLLVIVLADGRAPFLEADSFTPGGRALREMVRFYWKHPDHRTELTDGRALKRLRDNAF